MIISDLIAEWFKEHEMLHAFGIIGAGNASIFDAVHRLGYTDIICTHHEQAAAMAANAYYRTCGKIAPVLLTTGAGSSNALTGVLAAHMDSIPMLVIAGNEPKRYHDRTSRAHGVQGYASALGSDRFSLGHAVIKNESMVTYTLNSSMKWANVGRGGPYWIEIPMDVQSSASVEQFDPGVEVVPRRKLDFAVVNGVIDALKEAQRPVIWLGNGVRLAGGPVGSFLDSYRCPTMLSWSGADLLDNGHWLHYGRPGVYGQRCANRIVQEADMVLAVGTRLALPQTAYASLRCKNIHMVDVDRQELEKDGDMVCNKVQADAREFMEEMIRLGQYTSPREWRLQCDQWRDSMPWLESPLHDHTEHVNSYRLMEDIQPFLQDDHVIVTDMGAALLSAHQALKLKKGQRLFTSQGLGEMGCGLPFAVGACFAGAKNVLCLNTDGGMMMNLQELQTIAHHNLPIKIIILCNDGYGMIRHTQDQQYGGRHVGVDTASGVSCPAFSANLARAFGIPGRYVGRDDVGRLDDELNDTMAEDGPAILSIEIDPHQKYLPKIKPGGQLEDMMP